MERIINDWYDYYDTAFFSIVGKFENRTGCHINSSKSEPKLREEEECKEYPLRGRVTIMRNKTIANEVNFIMKNLCTTELMHVESEGDMITENAYSIRKTVRKLFTDLTISLFSIKCNLKLELYKGLLEIFEKQSNIFDTSSEALEYFLEPLKNVTYSRSKIIQDKGILCKSRDYCYKVDKSQQTCDRVTLNKDITKRLPHIGNDPTYTFESAEDARKYICNVMSQYRKLMENISQMLVNYRINAIKNIKEEFNNIINALQQVYQHDLEEIYKHRIEYISEEVLNLLNTSFNFEYSDDKLKYKSTLITFIKNVINEQKQSISNILEGEFRNSECMLSLMLDSLISGKFSSTAVIRERHIKKCTCLWFKPPENITRAQEKCSQIDLGDSMNLLIATLNDMEINESNEACIESRIINSNEQDSTKCTVDLKTMVKYIECLFKPKSVKTVQGDHNADGNPCGSAFLIHFIDILLRTQSTVQNIILLRNESHKIELSVLLNNKLYFILDNAQTNID